MLNTPLVRPLFALAITLSVGPIAVGADPTVTIRTLDGRLAVGPVVERPDREGLRITSTAAGLVVSSRFAWTDVGDLQLDGRPVTAEEFLRWAEGRTWPAARPKPAFARPSSSTRASTLTAPPGAGSQKVESLVVAAEPAQWNADPFPDGLVVRVDPRNARGGLVPVRAELTLTLRGFRHHHFYRDSFRLEPQPVELETINVLLTEADFAAGPAVVRFPFSRTRPDRDFQVEPTCLLTARLGVPTQGAFEAVSPVMVRPWDPFVDRLPYFEGRTDVFRLRP